MSKFLVGTIITDHKDLSQIPKGVCLIDSDGDPWVVNRDGELAVYPFWEQSLETIWEDLNSHEEAMEEFGPFIVSGKVFVYLQNKGT